VREADPDWDYEAHHPVVDGFGGGRRFRDPFLVYDLGGAAVLIMTAAVAARFRLSLPPFVINSYQAPLSLTYHPDFQRKLVTGTLPPRAAADGPDCRRAMTEMESRNQRRLVSDSISLRPI
jgi:hypothetical protein